jgi:hypothetical protein
MLAKDEVYHGIHVVSSAFHSVEFLWDIFRLLEYPFYGSRRQREKETVASACVPFDVAVWQLCSSSGYLNSQWVELLFIASAFRVSLWSWSLSCMLSVMDRGHGSLTRTVSTCWQFFIPILLDQFLN